MLLEPLFVNAPRWIGAAVLLAVFALAAAAKLRDRDRARDGLIDFGVPERWARPALGALVLAELMIAALLAYPPAQLAGALGALGALTVFTLAIVWQLLRGRRPACACFGALTRSAIGWKSVARNLLLILLALAVVGLPEAPAAPISVDTAALPALAAAAWAAISAAWLLLLTRQNGRLLLRLKHLEQLAEGQAQPQALEPLRVGDIIPPLRLSDARGRPFDLGRFRGTPALLLFLDSACGHCRSLLARLRDAQPAGARLIVISERPSPEHDLPATITALIDPGWSTMTLFRLRGTPAAVAVDADGRLARLAVHGAPAVHAALDEIMSQEVRHELAPV